MNQASKTLRAKVAARNICAVCNLPEANHPAFDGVGHFFIRLPDGAYTNAELAAMARQVKVTLAQVLERKAMILAQRKVVDGFEEWDDPEGTGGDIDRLRVDVIQSIANGSKVPYALCRAIADLPEPRYGKVAVGK